MEDLRLAFREASTRSEGEGVQENLRLLSFWSATWEQVVTRV